MVNSERSQAHFSCGYFYNSMNFLVDGDVEAVSRPRGEFHALADYLERGYPTNASNWLLEQLRKRDKDFVWPSEQTQYPMSLKHKDIDWSLTIKGDDAGERYPAQKFFNEQIEKYLPEYAFIKNLMIPECKFSEILAVDPATYNASPDWAVDFFLPDANLVIEIDGPHHLEDPQKQLDTKRDAILKKHGIKTHRIPTYKVNEDGPEISAYFEALSNELKRVPQVAALALQNQTTEHRGHGTYLELTAISRLQRTITALIADGKLTDGSRVEIKCDFVGSNDWVSLAHDDLRNSYNILLPFLSTDAKFPKINLTLVDNFSGSSTHVKIEILLFRICDDAFELKPNQITVMSTLNTFEYLEIPKHGAVNKRLKVHFGSLNSIQPTNYNIQSKKSSSLNFVKNTFNIPNFRTGQFEIIQSASSSRCVLGLIPTGGGKSLTFQFLGGLETGCTIVVCPITALIRDHVIELNQFGFEQRVEYISAEITGSEREFIFDRLDRGQLKFLFLSPEQFQKSEFRARLKQLGDKSIINRVVVDEVHCMSEWGHDFRTSYLNLADTISKFIPKVPILCLTATAAVKVIEDIQIEFSIDDDDVLYFMQDSRAELTFNLIHTNNKMASLSKIIAEHVDENILTEDQGFLVFSPRVRANNFNGQQKLGLMEIASELRKENPDWKVGVYSGTSPQIWHARPEFAHLGLPYSETDNYDTYKQAIQSLFKKNKVNGIVATKAFGMGVNKPNIRLAVHYGMPQSMESLYQEAGRAGRDKHPASCVTLFTKEHDVPTQLHEVGTTVDEITQIRQKMQKSNGDLSQQLYFLTSSIKEIDTEADECLVELQNIRSMVKNEQWFETVWLNINEGQGKQKHERTKEKVIYRLKQLGFVKDWTVENFYYGQYNVQFKDQTLDELAFSIEKTISKYVGEDTEVAKTKNEVSEILQSASLDQERDLVKLLLRWNYNHFVYQRRQSLKTLYEACEKFTDPSEFKGKLESYFKFDKTSSLLESLLKANTTNAIKIVNGLLLTKYGKLRKRAGLDSLSGSLSRYLESYRSNTGLNLLSGLLRLANNDFGNSDGEARFKNFLDEIQNTSDVEQLLTIIRAFNKQQQDLALTTILKRARSPSVAILIFEQTGHLLAEQLVLEHLNERLENII